MLTGTHKPSLIALSGQETLEIVNSEIVFNLVITDEAMPHTTEL